MNRQDILSALVLAEKAYGIVDTLHIFYGSNIKMRLGYTRSACEASIDEMQLSVRSWNALRRVGIATVGELIDTINSDGLMKIRNLGRKSMIEIKTKIMMMGFSHLSEREKMAFFEFLVDNNTLRSGAMNKSHNG